MPGSTWTGLERSTVRVSASSSAASVCSSAASALGSACVMPLGRVDQRFEHHGDARQDRILDPLERLFEARLLLVDPHRAGMSGPGLSLGEGEFALAGFSATAMALAVIASFLLSIGGIRLVLVR